MQNACYQPCKMNLLTRILNTFLLFPPIQTIRLQWKESIILSWYKRIKLTTNTVSQWNLFDFSAYHPGEISFVRGLIIKKIEAVKTRLPLRHNSSFRFHKYALPGFKYKTLMQLMKKTHQLNSSYMTVMRNIRPLQIQIKNHNYVIPLTWQ